MFFFSNLTLVHDGNYRNKTNPKMELLDPTVTGSTDVMIDGEESFKPWDEKLVWTWLRRRAGCIPVFSGCDEVKSSRREAVGRAALNDVLHALLLEKTRSGALTNVCVEIRRGDRVIAHMCANQCCNESVRVCNRGENA